MRSDDANYRRLRNLTRVLWGMTGLRPMRGLVSTRVRRSGCGSLVVWCCEVNRAGFYPSVQTAAAVPFLEGACKGACEKTCEEAYDGACEGACEWACEGPFEGPCKEACVPIVAQGG